MEDNQQNDELGYAQDIANDVADTGINQGKKFLNERLGSNKDYLSNKNAHKISENNTNNNKPNSSQNNGSPSSQNNSNIVSENSMSGNNSLGNGTSTAGAESAIEGAEGAGATAEGAKAAATAAEGAASAGIALAAKVAYDTLKTLITEGDKGFAKVTAIVTGLVVGFLFAIVLLVGSIMHSLFPVMSEAMTELSIVQDEITSVKEEWDEAEGFTGKTSLVVSAMYDGMKATLDNFLEGITGISIRETVNKFNRVHNDSPNTYQYSQKGETSPYADTLEANITLQKKAISKYYKSAKNQIKEKCEESGYDYDLSLDSFENFDEQYPPFGNDYEDVNYKELLAITSQSKNFDIETYDIVKFQNFIESDEAIKHYYWLKFLPFKKEIKNEAGDKIKVVMYYEVQIYKYSLSDIYDLYGMSPYDPNYKFAPTQNYDLLAYQEVLIETYADNVFLGSDERTPLTRDQFTLKDPIKDNVNSDSTGITDDYIYEDNIADIINEKEVDLAIPNYYNQAVSSYTNSNNRNIKENLLVTYANGKKSYDKYCALTYGQGCVGTSGCCMVSLIMIGEYYTKQQLSIKKYQNPEGPYETYDKSMGGYYINKYTMLSDLGITLNYEKPYNLTIACDTLASGYPIMIHFPKSSAYTNSGHYAVIKGYNIDKKIFYMYDPGSRSRTVNGISFKDMAINADKMYVYKK